MSSDYYARLLVQAAQAVRYALDRILGPERSTEARLVLPDHDAVDALRAAVPGAEWEWDVRARRSRVGGLVVEPAARPEVRWTLSPRHLPVEQLTTLITYLVWQHRDGPQFWGGRTGDDALDALAAILGFSREQLEQVAGLDDGTRGP